MRMLASLSVSLIHRWQQAANCLLLRSCDITRTIDILLPPRRGPHLRNAQRGRPRLRNAALDTRCTGQHILTPRAGLSGPRSIERILAPGPVAGEVIPSCGLERNTEHEACGREHGCIDSVTNLHLRPLRTSPSPAAVAASPSASPSSATPQSPHLQTPPPRPLGPPEW